MIDCCWLLKSQKDYSFEFRIHFISKHVHGPAINAAGLDLFDCRTSLI